MLNLYNREQYPKLKSVLNLDNHQIYFTTNTSSNKINQIINNPKSCVYFIIEDEWKGVMFNGKIEIETDIERKKEIWQDEWVAYGTKDYLDPDYSILKLSAEYIKGWTGNQKTELKTSNL